MGVLSVGSAFCTGGAGVSVADGRGGGDEGGTAVNVGRSVTSGTAVGERPHVQEDRRAAPPIMAPHSDNQIAIRANTYHGVRDRLLRFV